MDAGAEAIIEGGLHSVQPLEDAVGEPGTNVGGMLATVRDTMGDLTDQSPEGIRIRDVLAVDTYDAAGGSRRAWRASSGSRTRWRSPRWCIPAAVRWSR